MSKFSARYARKIHYCDIACRALRKKNAIFLTFAPPIQKMDRRPCLCTFKQKYNVPKILTSSPLQTSIGDS